MPSPPPSPAPAPAPLPYYHLNVPPALRPPTCPPFLADISPRDVAILAVPAAAFSPLSWADVRAAVRANRIDAFRRAPLDHRNYLAYMARLRREWGSVAGFVEGVRLGWGGEGDGEDGEKGEGGFEGEGNVKIIYNDWPYGIDKSIVHLCVWTKFPLDVDEKDPNGDLTPEMRGKIDAYVNKTFGSRVPAENIIWFKNWAKLKSIRSMEHFHVMMKDPDMEFIKEITKGDSPASAQFAEGEILE